MSTTVLFVAEAVTLAHVVRLVTLADALHRKGTKVMLATDPRYARIVGPLPFPVVDLHSMPPARFQHAITSGSPIFDFPTLDRYVTDDLTLLERAAPRVVVGDFRVSLSVSARLARIPFVNLTNAYWSPLSRGRQLVPEFDWVRLLGVPISQTIYRAFQRLGYMQHAVPINRLRRKHGLPGIGNDFRAALMDGDVTCFADWPEIVPMAPLPAWQHFIGPVPWSPTVALPPWWEQRVHGVRQRPLVYLTLGSSGPKNALQQVLDGLDGLPVDVIASTAGPMSGLRVPANVQVAELLPGDAACAAADLVVCNGGSPGTYQALVRGKPVIGVATNMDQFLNMTAVEDAGCGRLVRSRSATAAVYRRLVLAMLGDQALLARAKALARTVSADDVGSRFARVALAGLVP